MLSTLVQFKPFNLRTKGFTLYELMVVLAIAGGLLFFVAPSFARLVQQQRLTVHVNDLVAHVNLARSEAIKRGVNVLLCRSKNLEACSNNAEWHDGWIVFVDSNDNEQRDTGEELVRIQQALHPGVTLRFGSLHATYLAYRPGGVSHQNGTFTFCDMRGVTAPRAIIVNLAGRPYVSARRSNGDPLSCG